MLFIFLPSLALNAMVPPTAGRAVGLSRRALLGGAAAAALVQPPRPALAVDETLGLEDLPVKAKQAYLKFLPQFQLDGDYFTFELAPLLSQPGRWDLIFKLTEAQTAGAATTVSRLDREFITPMRQVALAFPPDMYGEEMQDSIDNFQKAMFRFSTLARRNAQTGNTAGPSQKEIKEVEEAFNACRVSLNAFFAAVNSGVGAARLTPIPTVGEAIKGENYPRSKVLYTQLLKDAALCRNRGGEVLAGLWGQLMVYGTVPGVNPCGNAAEAYYRQGLQM
jgi:hypothetical protein